MEEGGGRFKFEKTLRNCDLIPQTQFQTQLDLEHMQVAKVGHLCSTIGPLFQTETWV